MVPFNSAPASIPAPGKRTYALEGDLAVIDAGWQRDIETVRIATTGDVQIIHANP